MANTSPIQSHIRQEPLLRSTTYPRNYFHTIIFARCITTRNLILLQLIYLFEENLINPFSLRFTRLRGVARVDITLIHAVRRAEEATYERAEKVKAPALVST